MKVVHVAAAIIRRAGRILICSRPPGKPPAGWEFPGGKIEAGESPAAALRREIAEELDVEAHVLDSVGELEHRYPERSVKLYFLRAVIPPGVEPAPREGQSCRWVEIGELDRCGLLPADRPLAKFLQ